MKRYYIFLILLFLIYPHSYSEVKNNGLEKRLERFSGNKKIDSLLSMANMNIADSSEKAIKYCNEALELANSLGNKQGIAFADYCLGKIYAKSDNFDEALKKYQNALKIFQDNYNDTMIANTEIEKGLVYFMKPDIYQAKISFNKALDSYSRKNDSSGTSIAYYNLGRCYRIEGDLDLALDNSLKSLQFKEADNHNALNIIGIIYAMKGDMDKAFEHQVRALNIREKLNLQEEVIGSLNNLGLISMQTNKLDQGLEYLLKSVAIAEKIDKKSQLNRALNNIGLLYDDYLDEPEKALQYYQRSLYISKEIKANFEIANTLMNIGMVQSKLKKYDLAIKNLEDGLALAKEIGAKVLIENAYMAIYKYYEQLGDFYQAFENYKSFVAIKDTIFSEESNDKIMEMQIKYETEKKEKENEIYKLEINKERLEKTDLFFGLILFFIIIVVFYFMYLMKNKSNRLLRKEIIEHKKTEEALKLAIDDLNAFSYSVSHDLRAPLRGLNGFTKILIENHSSEIDAEGKRLLSLITSSAEKMNKLIEDLLGFSRLGRKEIVQSSFDMNKLVTDVINELKLQSPGRNIKFKTSQLPVISADYALIRQVIINLLSNAVKFTQQREEAFIEVSDSKKEGYLVFYVRDNGVGFEKKYADKLFNPFQRLHSSKEFEGNGVGLAIVRKIIERHGGRVWAEAEVDKGATFYFSIPVQV